MRTALVIVLAAATLTLAWVFGLTLNLFAGFGMILLAIAAEGIHTGTGRAPRRAGDQAGPVVAMPELEQNWHGLDHERSRAA